MYRVICDGFPLLDWRDKDLVLADPKVSLEVNTVGEGSFTIYKNHPHFAQLKPMKSVVEVSDETGVIFRGRVTGDTVDFDHGMHVDLEGVMAFFNDSIVRPFRFPDDFLNDADYKAAEASGELVAFFLGWLIENHNSQVQDFQKLKLGNVTVCASQLTRYASEYVSTWESIKQKLCDSPLGGYLCVRYEEDGNYIDYLSEFTETNRQEIVFGENLLDLRNQREASGVYTAIIPFGALGLTLAGVKDGDITDDIVKSGDTLYSRKAVEQFGWIYAPTDSTTWDDVVDDADLLKAGVEWLSKGGAFLNAMEATAVDLHFTDAQIESLRIYKNVRVYSEPHGLSEIFPLSRLEIDLLHPQNTKITVGKTLATYTEQAALQQEEAKKNYSKLSKTDEQIRLEVVKIIGDIGTDEHGDPYTVASKIDMTAESIALEVSGIIGDLGTDDNGNPLTVASKIQQTAEEIALHVEGYFDTDEWGRPISVSSSIKTALNGITLEASSAAGSSTFTIKSGGVEIATTELNLTVDAANISGNVQLGGLLSVYTDGNRDAVGGYLGYDNGFNSEYGIGIRTWKNGVGPQVVCTNKAARISCTAKVGDEIVSQVGVTCGTSVLTLEAYSMIQLAIDQKVMVDIDGNGIYPAANYLTLGTTQYPWLDVYAAGTTMSDLLARVEALEAAA